MSRHFISRIIAALVCGFLFGWYVNYDYLRWNRLGREAFLAYQVQRFDAHMATPDPMALTLVSIGVAVVGFLALYELLVLGFSTALKAKISDTPKT
jgi:uncharacterized membrane protein SpoIIM required for sporulation